MKRRGMMIINGGLM